MSPILDEDNPNSTGSLASAAAICDVLGIPLGVDAPSFHYERGLRHEELSPASVICSWTLIIEDLKGRPTSLT